MIALSSRLHRRLAWLALLAMLAMAVFPTVSHALAAARGDSAWLEVCTAQGVRMVEAGDNNSAPADAGAHQQNCPYCAQGAAALGMPPTPSAAFVLPEVGVAMPALFLHAPRTAHAWCSAQPRAPPQLS